MKFQQHKLSHTDRRYLSRAQKAAQLSSCKFKHGAIYVKGGRVMSVGVNSYLVDCSMLGQYPEDVRSIHAEEACMRALKGAPSGGVLYVARVNRLGVPRMSLPCAACQKMLKEAGVKRVVYTIDSSLELQ